MAEFAQHFDVAPPLGRDRTRPHRAPIGGAGFLHLIPEQVELRKVGPRPPFIGVGALRVRLELFDHSVEIASSGSAGDLPPSVMARVIMLEALYVLLLSTRSYSAPLLYCSSARERWSGLSSQRR